MTTLTSLYLPNAIPELNDTIAQAVKAETINPNDADIVLSSDGLLDYVDYAHGFIDNKDDVDLVSMELLAGDQVTVAVHAVDEELEDPMLRLFDSQGTEVAFNDDSDGYDPLINFTASTPGTYYAGVSTYNNSNYDPFVEGSGFDGSSEGGYVINIERNPSSTDINEEETYSEYINDKGERVLQKNSSGYDEEREIITRSRIAVVETPTTNTQFITRVLELTNEHRAQNGLAPLTLNRELTAAAYGHSRDMAIGDFTTHTGSDGSEVIDRTRRMGYEDSLFNVSLSENIAWGWSTPEVVVQQWINSDVHNANLLKPEFTELGVGYYYRGNDTGSENWNHYWTQNFGTGDNNPETTIPSAISEMLDSFNELFI